MEIDISDLQGMDLFLFSHSRAEGGDNAGPETWANAMVQAEITPLMKEEDLEDFRKYIGEFGAWEDEEIAGWNLQECNALLIQFIAGDVREKKVDYLEDLEDYPDSIYKAGDKYYYYVGI